MEFIKSLPTKTLLALVFLIVAKMFGGMAMLATFVSFILSAVLGAFWGIFIIAAGVMSVWSWYSDRKVSEKELYEKLKLKYG